jgi:hypothetical protein
MPLDVALQTYLIELLQRFSVMPKNEIQDDELSLYSQVENLDIYYQKVEMAFVKRKERADLLSIMYKKGPERSALFKDLIFIFENWTQDKVAYRIQTTIGNRISDLIMREIQANDLNLKHQTFKEIGDILSGICQDKILEHALGNVVFKLIKLLRTQVMDVMYEDFRKDFSLKWRRRTSDKTRVLSIEKYNKYLNDTGQGRRYLAFPKLQDFLSQLSEAESSYLNLSHEEKDRTNEFKSSMYNLWNAGLFREAILVYKDYRVEFHSVINPNLERLLKKRLALKRKYKKERGNKPFSQAEFNRKYKEAKALYSLEMVKVAIHIDAISYLETKQMVSLLNNAILLRDGNYEGSDPLVIEAVSFL